MLRLFRDSKTYDKKFYHVNVMGWKFRVAVNPPRKTLSKFGTYLTGRGRVFNFGRQYVCYIPKS